MREKRRQANMSHLNIRKAMLLAAVGASMALALPAVAQAAAASPAVHAAQAARSQIRPNGEIEWFTGDTYPDTSAGLAACTARGVQYESTGAGSWSCWLGNPDAGLYGLWILSPIRS
jgi:hypothetical protein